MKALLFLALLTFAIAQNQCCSNNVLSIIGAGSISVSPDTASFNVEAYAKAKTSALALKDVNQRIKALSEILKNYNIPITDFSTSSINLNPEYNYQNGVQILSGQRASQTLSIKIKSLANPNRIGNLITALSDVNNITISGLTFDVANKIAAERQARGAAVADARKKAVQYAKLSNRVLGPVKSVADENRQTIVPYFAEYNFYRLQAKTLSVPYGKVQVSASVKIDWALS